MPPGFANDNFKTTLFFLRRVMSWQSRTVAVFFIMIPCLLNFSSRFDSFGTTSSETVRALNLQYISFYLTASNSSPLHPLAPNQPSAKNPLPPEPCLPLPPLPLLSNPL